MVRLGFMKLPFACSVGASFQDIVDLKEFDCQTINVQQCLSHVDLSYWAMMFDQ